MKTCNVCDKRLRSSSFYAGITSACKKCWAAHVRKNRRVNDAVRTYDRARSLLPARKIAATKVTKEWREANPKAYKAQNAINNAIRDGKLKKEPCLFCGEVRVHGHHRDYSTPLEVVWLCAKCHHRLHANFPEAAGH